MMLFTGQSGEARHVCGREDGDSCFEPASNAQETPGKWVWMYPRWWSSRKIRDPSSPASTCKSGQWGSRSGMTVWRGKRREPGPSRTLRLSAGNTERKLAPCGTSPSPVPATGRWAGKRKECWREGIRENCSWRTNSGCWSQNNQSL